MKPLSKHLNEAKRICKEFNISCSFKHTGNGSEVDVYTRSLVIDLDESHSVSHLFSLLFHEIGHIWCFENGKYVNYHTDCNQSDRMSTYVRKMGLRAERYVDKIGKELMSNHMPKLKYTGAYDTNIEKKWYDQWIDETYPLHR